MKKLDRKGFTLIELLAVITILGILMLVAIPAVSRTIENSRRDTFADVAGEYLTAVRNGVLADEIECSYSASGDKWTVASALSDGTYYFPICTNEGTTVCKTVTFGSGTSAITMTTTEIVASTTDLLESGGKSPFGNADVHGYVMWTKSSRDAMNSASGSSTAGDKKTTTEYKVLLQDTGKHGLAAPQASKNLKRSVVLPTLTTDLGNAPRTSGTTSDIPTRSSLKGVCRMA